MKLSSRTQYAILALSYMVRHYDPQGYVLISDIATEEHLPRKFLEHVMLDLRKGGVVESKPGRHGGYRLTQPPNQSSLGEALRAVEGRLTPLPSWVGKSGGESLGQVLLRVRYAVRDILDNTTLEVLAQSSPEETIHDLNYFV